MKRIVPIILATSLCLGAADAQDAKVGLDIPAQSLSTALDTLAEQAAIEVLYPEEALAGKQSRPLEGEYTTREAVAALLAGSGMRYVFTAEASVVVKTAEATPPPKPEATELPEMTVTASPLDETSYNVPNATTATKTDTPIMETPFGIQVIPQQVLRDQQVVRIDKALENVSGVYVAPQSGSFPRGGYKARSGFGDSKPRTITATASGYSTRLPLRAHGRRRILNGSRCSRARPRSSTASYSRADSSIWSPSNRWPSPTMP